MMTEVAKKVADRFMQYVQVDTQSDPASTTFPSTMKQKDLGEILLKELSDGKDIAIIAAGYPDEMDVFLESNPGLKSRFRMIYDFPDYAPQELMEIADVHSNDGYLFIKDSKGKKDRKTKI